MIEPTDRLWTAANLLGAEDHRAAEVLRETRLRLPNSTEDEIVSIAIDSLRRDQRQAALMRARESVGG